MSKSIGESLFEVLIMLNFTAKIHFFVRTAKFLTKKLSEIYFLCIFATKYNKQNFYSLISETSDVTSISKQEVPLTAQHEPQGGLKVMSNLNSKLTSLLQPQQAFQLLSWL